MGARRARQPHAARIGSLIDDDVEFEIFHRRIKVFLDGFLKAMDLVDEQNVAFLEVGQQTGEVGGFLDGGSTGCLEGRTHRLGENVGEGGFAETGWTAQQDMVESLAALPGRLDGEQEERQPGQERRGRDGRGGDRAGA